MVEPSCPALVILDDDGFRRSLIRTLDERYFSVTFSVDGDEAVKVLEQSHQKFNVIIVGLDLSTKRGMKVLEYLRDHREQVRCGVIIVGEPNPKVRTFAPWSTRPCSSPSIPPTSPRAQGRTATARTLLRNRYWFVGARSSAPASLDERAGALLCAPTTLR